MNSTLNKTEKKLYHRVNAPEAMSRVWEHFPSHKNVGTVCMSCQATGCQAVISCHIAPHKTHREPLECQVKLARLIELLHRVKYKFQFQ